MSKAAALARLSRKLTVENLWIYVLAVLLEGPTYAYDVKRKIRSKFNFNPSTITLYAVIYKLRRDGLIRLAKEQPPLYEVTPEGLAALKEAVEYIENNVHKVKELLKEGSSSK